LHTVIDNARYMDAPNARFRDISRVFMFAMSNWLGLLVTIDSVFTVGRITRTAHCRYCVYTGSVFRFFICKGEMLHRWRWNLTRRRRQNCRTYDTIIIRYAMQYASWSLVYL